MKKMTLLGGITPAQFLRDYWHKKPLLIRQAIPGFQPLLSREELFELARHEGVESRLITCFKQQWRMANGPCQSLPALNRKAWTLLVQGVNLHSDASQRLLGEFRFIPEARLDDLMISYATQDGGVGPHVDSYDVFLLQAHGQRRWRIGDQKDLSLAKGMPLKILRNFEPQQEFILEPGDMLYLPPHYAHEGVALSECMTYSIGFRAPSYQELGEAFLQFMADSIDLPGRYADPDLTPTRHPAKIGRAMLAQIAGSFNKIKFTADDIAIFMGEYLSEPKAHLFFAPPQCPVSFNRFMQTSIKRGITLSTKTRALYQGKYIFINGASFAMKREDKTCLCQLADTRQLKEGDLAQASQDVLETLHAWYLEGWIHLG